MWSGDHSCRRDAFRRFFGLCLRSRGVLFVSSKPQDRTNQQSKPRRRAGWRSPVSKAGAAKGASTTATYHAPAQVIIDQGDGKTLHIHVAGSIPFPQPWLASAGERSAAMLDEKRAIEETDRALAQVAANVEVMRRDQQEINQLRAETRVVLHQLGVA
jgi:hypothetical protein